MAISTAPTAPAVTAVPKRGKPKAGLIAASQRRAGYLMVLPYVIFFIIMQFGALAFAIWVSFHHYDLLAVDNPFVGLRNYLRLPSNELFLISLRNTTEYAVVVVIVQTAFALLLAVLLDSKIRGRNFFRSTWYTPSIASSVVISMIFLWVYHPTGLLNDLLGLIGIHTTEAYLTDTEAAQVDGAGPIRKLFGITIPLLRPVIFLVVALGIIGSFQIFDQAFIMTKGGPLHATLTVALQVYNNLFSDTGQVGVACAMAVTLGIIIFALTIVTRRLIDVKIEY
jgi:multiple sugar transport system permease protein